MGIEETMFQERLKFLEREPISNKHPTVGCLIIFSGDEQEYKSSDNIINLAKWKEAHRMRGKNHE